MCFALSIVVEVMGSYLMRLASLATPHLCEVRRGRSCRALKAESALVWLSTSCGCWLKTAVLINQRIVEIGPVSAGTAAGGLEEDHGRQEV